MTVQVTVCVRTCYSLQLQSHTQNTAARCWDMLLLLLLLLQSPLLQYRYSQNYCLLHCCCNAPKSVKGSAPHNRALVTAAAAAAGAWRKCRGSHSDVPM
jgi:hypothetical protein